MKTFLNENKDYMMAEIISKDQNIYTYKSKKYNK